MSYVIGKGVEEVEAETKVLLLDGTYHIIKGHPTDYIEIVDESGIMRNRTVRSKNGRRIKLSKVVTMQLNK